MSNSNKTKACLAAQKATPNFDINYTKAWEEIDNYRQYYQNKGVGKEFIFYGAFVDSEKLMELCSQSPKIKIYIAKSTVSTGPGENPNDNDYEDFKFLITCANEDGVAYLEDKGLAQNFEREWIYPAVRIHREERVNAYSPLFPAALKRSTFIFSKYDFGLAIMPSDRILILMNALTEVRFRRLSLAVRLCYAIIQIL